MEVLDITQLESSAKQMKVLNKQMARMVSDIPAINDDPVEAWFSMLPPLQVRMFLTSTSASLKLFEDSMNFNARHYKSAVGKTDAELKSARSDFLAAKKKETKLKQGASHKRTCMAELKVKLKEETDHLQVFKDLDSDLRKAKELEVQDILLQRATLKVDIKAIKSGKAKDFEDLKQLMNNLMREEVEKKEVLWNQQKCLDTANEAIVLAKQARVKCEGALALATKYLTVLVKRVSGSRQVIKEVNDLNALVAIASLNPLTSSMKSVLGPLWEVDFSIAEDIELNHLDEVLGCLSWLVGQFCTVEAAELYQCYMNHNGYIKFKNAEERRHLVEERRHHFEQRRVAEEVYMQSRLE